MAHSSTQADTSMVHPKGSNNKSIDLLTCTIRTPPFSYVHLCLACAETTTSSADNTTQLPDLEELQLKSYCTAACRQFLGLTGAAIPIDILKVEGAEGWVRVPREDLGKFSAALTMWKGTVEEGAGRVVLRVKKCSDWLGMMVGTKDQERLWGR